MITIINAIAHLFRLIVQITIRGLIEVTLSSSLILLTDSHYGFINRFSKTCWHLPLIAPDDIKFIMHQDGPIQVYSLQDTHQLVIIDSFLLLNLFISEKDLSYWVITPLTRELLFWFYLFFEGYLELLGKLTKKLFLLLLEFIIKRSSSSHILLQ